MKKLFITTILVNLLAACAVAQSNSFSYQGSLKTNGSPANGNYDFQFALFDSFSGGTQVGGTLVVPSVSVANGVFSAVLNFGSNFPGANRYLEIGVRQSGATDIFTILTPRQQVNSAPYSIKSLSADTATSANNLGGVAANQFVVTTDPRLSDARQPVSGNSSYVQNRTTTQTAANFNISGVGNASVFNAAVQFNLNGNRILGVSGLSNTFGGLNAGANASSLAEDNTFFGNAAGQTMVTAGGNSFFGSGAGELNTNGGGNSFFGSFAGNKNTSSDSNSFFGANAGTNSTGGDNSFFGRSAGSSNTTGGNNSYFGVRAGLSNTTSINNSFFGFEAGKSNTAANNSFFGVLSGTNTISGTENSFFGRNSGLNNDSGSRNTFVGRNAGQSSVTGSNNTAIGYGADVAEGVSFGTAIGAGVTVSSGNNVVIGRSGDKVSIPGRLEVAGNIEAPGIETINFANSVNFDQNATFQRQVLFEGVMGTIFPQGGITPICSILVGPNDAYRMPSRCNSSRRFKTNILPFTEGLSLINKLRPVSFDWKTDKSADIGLIAEEVAEAEPRLATTDKGVIEGVKYDRIGVIAVSAIKEQQAQIEAQQKQIDMLQKQIDELKRLLCSQNVNLCKEEK